MAWGDFFAFRVYLSSTPTILDLTRSSEYHLDLSFSGICLAFPPSLGVFRLYRRALLAIGLVTSYGLATTLDIVIHCNIAIKSESVCSALLACGVKYVRPLATTLDIAVRCNTAIRLESVHCALRLMDRYLSAAQQQPSVLPSVETQPSNWSLSAIC